MKFSFPSLTVAAGLLLASGAMAQTLTIRNDVPGNSSTPNLYGLMYEDINRCGDSGIYGQMLRNWNFQANDTGGEPDLEFWNVIGGENLASIALDTKHGLNDINSNSLRLDVATVTNGRVGIANEGWWGIRVQPDETYKASFFAKASDGFSGPLNVTLESIEGTVVASASVDGLSDKFQKFEVELKANVKEVSIDNVFGISVDSKDAEGKSIWFQVLTLFGETYKGRENGLRSDLAETLEGLDPHFFRFPGGNNLEGLTIDQRWKWNETVGPLEERKGRLGNWGYWNTNGQGLLDYMYLIEDFGMTPILDVWAGFSLGDHNSVRKGDLGPYVEEVMNQLEYLMGDTTTKYGKLRAEHGREEPFEIPYIEIGNEDFFSTTYEYRYAPFYDAITAKYPNATIISTGAQESRPYGLLDDHFYVTSDELIDMFNYYDNYARSGNGTGIFVGEFASSSKHCCNNSPSDMEAALADSVFITGLERNSDFIKMIAYAPYLKRHDHEQIDPDMIHFTTDKIWVSPFYYVMQMYNKYDFDTILQVDADDINFGPLYWVAGSNKEKKQVYVKAVNIGGDEQSVSFNFKGLNVQENGEAHIVAGHLLDQNNFDSPNTVQPKKSDFKTKTSSLDYTFEPYSATVLVLDIN